MDGFALNPSSITSLRPQHLLLDNPEVMSLWIVGSLRAYYQDLKNHLKNLYGLRNLLKLQICKI